LAAITKISQNEECHTSLSSPLNSNPLALKPENFLLFPFFNRLAFQPENFSFLAFFEKKVTPTKIENIGQKIKKIEKIGQKINFRGMMTIVSILSKLFKTGNR